MMHRNSRSGVGRFHPNSGPTKGMLFEGNIGGRGSDSGTAGGDSGNPDGGTSRDSDRFNSGGGGGGGGSPDPEPPSVDVTDSLDGSTDNTVDPVTQDDALGQQRGEFRGTPGVVGGSVAGGVDDSGGSGGGESGGGDPPEVFRTDDGRLASPELVDRLNQQTEGADIESTTDPRVSIERQDDGGFRVSYTPQQPGADTDAVAVDGDGPPSSTATDPLGVGGAPSLDNTTVGGLTINDLTGPPSRRREAISDRAKQAVGVNPDDFEAPLRSGIESGKDVLGGALGVTDSGDIDPSASSLNSQEGGVAGAAALGVAAPEPVSSAGGAAVLSGLAVGGAITGAAGEIATPEEADDPFNNRELAVDESAIGGGAELTIDPQQEPQSELDVPSGGSGGEIDVPQRSPGTTTGEVGVPSVEAQQLIGQEEQFNDDVTQPEIDEGDIPADPFGTPQDRGGTPDRFIRDDRDAFVFPGSPVGTGTEPAADTTATTAARGGENILTASRPRGGVDTLLGGVSDADAGVFGRTAADERAGVFNQPAADTELNQFAEPADTQPQFDNPAETTTNEQATNNTLPRNRARGRGRKRNRQQRRLKRPRMPDMREGDGPPEEQDENDLASEIAVFSVATLQQVDDAVTDDVLNP